MPLSYFWLLKSSTHRKLGIRKIKYIFCLLCLPPPFFSGTPFNTQWAADNREKLKDLSILQYDVIFLSRFSKKIMWIFKELCLCWFSSKRKYRLISPLAIHIYFFLLILFSHVLLSSSYWRMDRSFRYLLIINYS